MLIILLPLFLVSCGAYEEPLDAKVTELYACQGWDETGKPIGISNTFPSNTNHIFACGKLDVNRESILVAVEWHYENRLIYWDDVENAKGYFYSLLEAPEEGYASGKYRIGVVIIKNTVQSTEFWVE